MNVLVTGGAGYIGSHVAKALAFAGHTPVVLDNLSAGHASAVQWGDLITADLGDADQVRGVFAENPLDSIVHLAASAYVGESVDNPRKYYENNVVATLNLLNAAMDSGVSRFVFSSSCATYGISDQLPISEDSPQRPVNPYGESKLMCEWMLRSYERAYGLQWVALRYFNAAGADLDGEIGEDHDPETHLIPVLIGAALGFSGEAPIYGTDYPTPDGTAVRDYVHVTDLADAHVKAIDYLDRGGSSRAFTGTNSGHSIREIIAAIEARSGKAVPVKEMPRRTGDPPVLIADATAASRELGWTPVNSKLETVIDSAWKWHARYLPQMAE